jgi:hypothetical protein
MAFGAFIKRERTVFRPATGKRPRCATQGSPSGWMSRSAMHIKAPMGLRALRREGRTGRGEGSARVWP